MPSSCQLLLLHLVVVVVLESGSAAPGRPKAPVGRAVWTGEENDDISSGLLPYLIVFVVFPISLMLVCICAKYAARWCSRELVKLRLAGSHHHHHQQQPSCQQPPPQPQRHHRQPIRTISGGTPAGRFHANYTDLRSFSGFFSFRPNTLMMATAVNDGVPMGEPAAPPLPPRGVVYEDTSDPPPNYPAEEPPPSYESLFEGGKKENDESKMTAPLQHDIDA